MTKVAKLVSVHPMVRVVVDDTATDEQIFKAARPKLIEALYECGMENLDEIKDDTECKYGSVPQDKQ
jgi:hypothetical protein